MGGQITFGFKLSNGKEYIQHIWTNILPFWLSNKGFLTEDKAAVNNLVKNIKKDDIYYKKFKAVKPIEYGLVLLDFKNKKLLSCQGYCNPLRLSFLFPDNKNISQNVLKLIADNQVTEIINTDNYQQPLSQEEISNFTLEISNLLLGKSINSWLGHFLITHKAYGFNMLHVLDQRKCAEPAREFLYHNKWKAKYWR